MEKSIERNNLKYKKPFDDNRFSYLDKKQKDLTEIYIINNKDELLEIFKESRTKVDRNFLKDGNYRKSSRFFDKPYPIGMCGEITSDIIEDVFYNKIMDSQIPATKYLKNFVRAGGVVKHIWVIDNDKYFQNAIQVGTSIFDVANDTVYKNREKILFYDSFEKSPFREIKNFMDFAEIVEKYWKGDIFVNRYFKNLLPLFPLMYTRDEHDKFGHKFKSLVIPTGVSYHFLMNNIFTKGEFHIDKEKTNIVFGDSYNFLFNSIYSQKKLPSEFIDDLYTRYKGKDFITINDNEKLLEEFLKYSLVDDEKFYNKLNDDIFDLITKHQDNFREREIIVAKIRIK